MDKTRVLFVCLGNICRSPMAEGLFLDKVKKSGLEDQISVDSAGTSGWHINEAPDKRMRAVAERNHIHLPSRSRKLLPEDLQNFDIILVMDESNLENTKELAGEQKELHAKIFKMRDFDPDHKGADVPDPYFGGDEGFEEVYQMLDRSTEELLNHITQKR